MKDRYVVIIAALIAIVIVSFEARRAINETPVPESEIISDESYAGISSSLLKDKITQGDRFILIDLRRNEEFKEGHIAGAVNIPVGEFENSISDLNPDREIILYCKSGPWSRQAYRVLKDKGYRDIKILINGIVGWKWEINGEVVTSP